VHTACSPADILEELRSVPTAQSMCTVNVAIGVKLYCTCSRSWIFCTYVHTVYVYWTLYFRSSVSHLSWDKPSCIPVECTATHSFRSMPTAHVQLAFSKVAKFSVQSHGTIAFILEKS